MILGTIEEKGIYETLIINETFQKAIYLKEAMAELDIEYNGDINQFIEHADEDLMNELDSLLQDKDLKQVDLNQVTLVPPIPNPHRNAACLGKNYLDHIKELKNFSNLKAEIPEYPIYFSKATYGMIGQNGCILRHPEATSKIDYEVELAIIIGKKGMNIPKEEAMDYIFGYTIANDISARDLQTRHVNWFKGKSLVSHFAMGPYLVHKSKFQHPLKLDISLKVNGEIRQASNTEHMIFQIPDMIADLSKGYMLLPGDIILTGTPAGVGMGFDPPRYLKSGDKVACAIEGLGTLTNFVE